MKIKKLEKDCFGRYEILHLFGKVNEIIDLLNNSFLTQEHDEAFVDTTNSLATISCDRLTPLSNELSMLESIQKNPLTDRKCPHCGVSYYTVGPSYTTLVNYPAVYKDGVNINEDHNTSTTKYNCCNCGSTWEETT